MTGRPAVRVRVTRSGCPGPSRASWACRLEELDRVARRVLGDDLASAHPVDDLVAKRDARLHCSRATVASMSSTSIAKRFQPPGAGWVPSGIDCPPGPAFGELSTSRSGPRSSIAKGRRVHHEIESERVAVERDRRVHVVDDVADADGCHFVCSSVG